MDIPELENLVVGDFTGFGGFPGGLLYLVADDGFVGLPMIESRQWRDPPPCRDTACPHAVSRLEVRDVGVFGGWGLWAAWDFG